MSETPPPRNISFGINPISMLVIQNRTYDVKILNQAQQLFELISKAILKDQNYILIDQPIYPVNKLLLANKGYFVEGNKIVWNDFLTDVQ